MTTASTTLRRTFFAVAAFGLATLGIAGTASAQPVATASFAVDARAGVQVQVRDHRTAPVHILPVPYPPDNDWRRNDRYSRTFRRYDLNRNGVLEAGESKGFWLTMAS